MPIYEYRCENGHVFETFQSMSDDPVTACEECGAPVERLFHPIAVHFKGSGFHNTDYKNKGKGAAQEAGKDGGDSSSGDSGSSDSGSGDSGSSDSSSSDSKSDSGSSEKKSDSASKSDSSNSDSGSSSATKTASD